MIKYVMNWSGGKDSTASVILAHEKKEPIDIIIYSEVMFDGETSGEYPEHIDFIKNTAIPKFEGWGYQVKILHAEKNYIDIFYHTPTKGKYKGTGIRQGFPMQLKCAINRGIKCKALNDYHKSLDDGYIVYLGIAADEPKRLARLKPNQRSILDKYNYTEAMAKELCQKYGLLSPVYNFTERNGCWFCPNIRDHEAYYLRKAHPELWAALLGLEKEKNIICPKWRNLEGVAAADLEEKFKWQDRQISMWDYKGD